MVTLNLLVSAVKPGDFVHDVRIERVKTETGKVLLEGKTEFGPHIGTTVMLVHQVGEHTTVARRVC